MQEYVEERTIAISVKAAKLSGKVLAAACKKVFAEIAKQQEAAKRPKGRQSVRKLMNHHGGKNAMKYVGAPKDFDRIAKEFHVDYAFHKTGPGHYLLFFKADQADAIQAAFGKYTEKVMGRSQDRPSILNASRLQTQGNNEPCSNFSLRTLLTELCEPYRLIAEAKGIKFKIELSSDAFVYLPEGRLKKAISNILSNAVNYTEAGQSISVVFDKNKLSVSNECSVLPPEQLQHIFEPFYRPDLAHSQATGGNGLGLYIVQTILDKLRLKYQFVPMPNDRGMSFTIQF